MQAYTTSAIQQEIRSYKKICATQRKLEADLLTADENVLARKEQLSHYQCESR